MKYIFSAIFLVTPLFVHAQNFIGVRAGANVSNITNKNFFDAKGRLSGMGAVTFEHFLNDRFSIGGELFYNSRGYKSDIVIRDEFNNTILDDEVTVRFNYLSIPLKAGVSFGNTTYTFFNGGVMPSFLLSNVVNYPELDSNNRPTGKRLNEKQSGGAPIDVAVLLEAGAGYKLDRCTLFVSLLGQRSLTKMGKGSNSLNMKHYGAGLSFGVKFKMN